MKTETESDTDANMVALCCSAFLRLLLVSSEDGELADASEAAPGTPKGLRTAASCVEVRACLEQGG
jgi:hypothetical protein